MIKNPLASRWKCRSIVSSTVLAFVGAVLIQVGGFQSEAQDAPLISGGVGFLTNTTGGVTSLQPVISPVAVVPLGQHLLIESRAYLDEFYFPKTVNNASDGPYAGDFFAGLTYLQLDYIAAPKLTVTVGDFLTPFGTYNERLTPIWISNFQDPPLIYPIGTQNGSSLGAMARGAAYSSSKVQLNYAAFFSVSSNVQQFIATRSAGGQFAMYLPNKRLELGASYSRVLQGQQSNSTGLHVWWQPYRVPLEIRSEYAHGPHSQGYWVETAYRLSQWRGQDSALGRFEPVFRMQQTFRDSVGHDELPAASTQQADFGFDYHLPHEVRVNTSYARRFSSAGNENIWETTLTYRFLFPVIGKGGSK